MDPGHKARDDSVAASSLARIQAMRHADRRAHSPRRWFVPTRPGSSPSCSSSRASFHPIRWHCSRARRHRARRSRRCGTKLGLDRPLLVQLARLLPPALERRPRHQPVHDAAGLRGPARAAAGDDRADARRHADRGRASAFRSASSRRSTATRRSIMCCALSRSPAWRWRASGWRSMLQLYFSMELGLAAAAGPHHRLSAAADHRLHDVDALMAGHLERLANALAHLTLPAVTLAVPALATVVRFTRAGVLDTLQQAVRDLPGRDRHPGRPDRVEVRAAQCARPRP